MYNCNNEASPALAACLHTPAIMSDGFDADTCAWLQDANARFSAAIQRVNEQVVMKTKNLHALIKITAT